MTYLSNTKTKRLFNKKRIKNKFSYEQPIKRLNFDYTNVYNVDLLKFNISNDKTNAFQTTKGINDALKYASENNYNYFKLPEGEYLIDVENTSAEPYKYTDDNKYTYTMSPPGIFFHYDNMIIDLENVTLYANPTSRNIYSLISVMDANNSAIINGNIIGDLEEHDYGMRINNEGKDFEWGDINKTTGELIESNNCIRTKNYINNYVDWFTKEERELPINAGYSPIWGTRWNTTDGGKIVVYCYDSGNNFIGICQDKGMADKKLLDGTAKIKITMPEEVSITSPIISICTDMTYYNPEFCYGIGLHRYNNFLIKNVKIKNFPGDCICTIDLNSLKGTNLQILNCDLSNCRRQGISITGFNTDILIANCNIHDINGTDPQSGIDIEHYTYVKNVIVENNTFYNNAKLDFINFNGNENIILRNNTFNGIVASTYGDYYSIHDNLFLHEDGINDDKQVRGHGIELSRCKYFYNNKVINYSYSQQHHLEYVGNNKIYNSSVNVIIPTIDIPEEYNDCDVTIRSSSNDKYNNITFTNCTIGRSNDGYKYTFNNCNFLNSKINIHGSIFNNCTISLNNNNSLMSPNCIFNKCTINSSTQFLPGSVTQDVTFNDCSIITYTGETIIYYDKKITFEKCKIHIKSNSSESINMWQSSNTDDWVFKECDFISDIPITIEGKIINCTKNDNITFSILY